MKWWMMMMGCVISTVPIRAQELPVSTEQQLERMTDQQTTEPEDDSYLLALEQYRKHPVDLNAADMDDLQSLRILSPLQMQSLLSYRKLLGVLISPYELQSIPGWDLITIRKIIPFIRIGPSMKWMEDLQSRFKTGDQGILFRVSQILEKSKGFTADDSSTKYLGSAQRIFFRYRYAYRDLLSFGIVADKDAGEKLFGKSQPTGFDFYSIHFFARKLGLIKAIALGDYTLSMGQGLIQWQGTAFGKGGDVMSVKRQSPVLLPYHSAGEIIFQRGAAISMASGKWEATAFFSNRRLSSSTDIDSNGFYFTSIQSSGLHRTNNELQDKNNLTYKNMGGNVRYRFDKGQVGINGILHSYSMPQHKRDEPYNLYAIDGSSWYNASIDYSYTYRNMHFFGEMAIDKLLQLAIINGVIMSIDPQVDLSILARQIQPAYQAINGNAFTESTMPSNERGLYAGLSWRPANAWRIDLNFDVFQFPWLKYLVDAPSGGQEASIQLYYVPSRSLEINARYRVGAVGHNEPGPTSNVLGEQRRKNFRLHMTCKLTPSVSLRQRMEWVQAGDETSPRGEGSLYYLDVLYHPMMMPLSGNLRCAFFETSGYGSRVYAYENDVLYGYSIPPLFGKGMRYYITLSYDLNATLTCWLRWASTIYRDQFTIGSGGDEISGKMRSEMKIQLRFLL